ncbi:LamG-like jellyroll fold domain-containing protein [Pedobacter sp. UBA4863]|uniref:LamG-like jellyroll fold domain-containing protein n=1 Tax=Pedobacter sp. UBA4863 TaxID=1947060 RepID=UPI0025D4D158|nr:LamG-like jellyroll fold domain-containing protein [Pedobacter sp. UBA4863]
MNKFYLLVISCIFQFTFSKAQNRSYSFAVGNSVTLTGACAALSQRTSFTIEFWAKFNSVSGIINLIDFTGGAEAGGLILNNGKFNVDFANDFGNLTESSALSLSTNTWYHIALVYENRTVDFYVDGVAKGSNVPDITNYDGLGAPLNGVTNYAAFNVGNLVFGAQNHGVVNDFVGGIDDIRLWSTARTQAQIQNARSMELVGNESGLLGYWKLNETSGTTVIDSKQSGTLTGTRNNASLNQLPAFSGTLPVLLDAFTVKATATGIALSWKTLSEQNADYFEVQQSNDGVSFKPLTRLAAKGNIGLGANYSYLDRNANNGRNYYKLLQYDKNMNVNDYGTKVLVYNYQDNEIKLFPNPSAHKISIDVTPGLYREINIIDLVGKTVLSVTLAKTQNEISLDVSSLPKGLYNVVFLGDTQSATNKFVKK